MTTLIISSWTVGRLRPGAASDWPFGLTPQERRLCLDGMNVKYLPGAMEDITAEPASGPPSSFGITRTSRTKTCCVRGGASPAALELLGLEIRDPYQPANWGAWELLLRGTGQWYHIRGGNDRLPHIFA